MSRSNVKPVDSNVLQLDDTRYSRLGWLLMLGGFVGFLWWAAFAPLDKGVAVSGKVMVSGHRKVVQHPSGGIVERIDVRDGLIWRVNEYASLVHEAAPDTAQHRRCSRDGWY